MLPDITCSAASRRADEGLMGTIKTAARVWFLLEYSGRWEHKATTNHELDQYIGDWLANTVKQVPESRLLFIKQPGRPGGLNLFVVLADEINPVIYHFEKECFEDMTSIDVEAVLRRDPSQESFRYQNPLYTVCTNGKHDPCCATYGIVTYGALAAAGGDAVWQSSHIGGHRFAATGICFPHGLFYGRIDLQKPAEYLDTYVKGRIGPGFRGRALYPKHAQIAEALLREYTDVMDVEAFRLIGLTEKNSGPEVIFEYPQAGTQFVINLFAEPVGQVPESCGSDKMAPLERWRGVFRESKIV